MQRKAGETSVTSNFVSSPDLTPDQYRSLLAIATLAVSHATMNASCPILVQRLWHDLNLHILTLGLYDPSTEGVSLNAWKAGETTPMNGFESLPVNNCASGWVWKTQRSVLVQDLAGERKLPVFLEALRQLGVRSYYVLPLTTTRQRLGAVGFGSSDVISLREAKLTFLRRLAALIASRLEAEHAGNNARAHADLLQNEPPVTLDLRQGCESSDLQEQAGRDKAFHGIVGDSPALLEVLGQVRTVASSDATVLLLGETGTGKELIARAIHQLSPRASNNFIKVNCSAIPTDLLESELFGHEKGAFTGAINRHTGRLELADNGTLLLDEVGDLPSAIQPKLLRVLQDKEFERLGGSRTLKVDVRLIAATNRDLRQGVAEGRFREDLFYRLNVLPIYIPPLRERKVDIPVLVRHFVSRYAREAKKSITTICAETMDALVNWSWPGNIRELQNLIQRCVILADSPVLNVPLSELRADANLTLGKVSEATERALILRALREAGGIIGGPSGAASRLGIKRTTLYSRMKKLNITPTDSQSKPS